VNSRDGLSEIAANARAELDLSQAIRWYDERSQKLGDDFLRCVYRCIASLERNPRAFPIVDQETRRALVRRFPFQILYDIENERSSSTRSIIPLATRKSGSDEEIVSDKHSWLECRFAVRLEAEVVVDAE
jgi:hypothetical protein